MRPELISAISIVDFRTLALLGEEGGQPRVVLLKMRSSQLTGGYPVTALPPLVAPATDQMALP